MRIIRLQSENFKRLKAVDISPDGDLVEVRGMNGNGKSSVLDSIFAALDAAGAKVEMPVRDGEEAAVIRLDLGEMVVTRTFTAHGTTSLKVTNGEGFAASSPQTMLDKLVGHISFDPLAFRDYKPEEQAAALRQVVEIVDPATGEVIDLDAIDKAIADAMARRRDVNRDGKAMAARVEAMGGVRHAPDDAPNRDDLVAQLAGAAEHNEEIARDKQRIAELQFHMKARRDSANQSRARANSLRAEADDLDKQGAEFDRLADLDQSVLDELPPVAEPRDVAAISAQLSDADNVEANRRHNAERDRLKAQYNELVAASAALTSAMKADHKRRVEAIAAAKMPVEGLSLKLIEDKLVVMFNGIPFSQASDADRLRVSAGVAMAANPKLRVLRLKDASLLDRDSIDVLRGMAQANDFQIWAEFVGDEGAGIIMEAGEVRGAPSPEPLDKPRARKPKEEKQAGAEASNDERKTRIDAGQKAGAVLEKTTSNNTPDASKDDAGSVTTLFGESPAPAPAKRAMRSFSTKPLGTAN